MQAGVLKMRDEAKGDKQHEIVRNARGGRSKRGEAGREIRFSG